MVAHATRRTHHGMPTRRPHDHRNHDSATDRKRNRAAVQAAARLARTLRTRYGTTADPTISSSILVRLYGWLDAVGPDGWQCPHITPPCVIVGNLATPGRIACPDCAEAGELAPAGSDAFCVACTRRGLVHTGVLRFGPLVLTYQACHRCIGGEW